MECQEHSERNYFQDLMTFMHDFQQQGILCDTILQLDDSEIKAHSVVLAAASPTLRASLVPSQTSASSGDVIRHYLIKMPGFLTDDCQVLMQAIYTGSAPDCLSGEQTERVERLFTALSIPFMRTKDNICKGEIPDVVLPESTCKIKKRRQLSTQGTSDTNCFMPSSDLILLGDDGTGLLMATECNVSVSSKFNNSRSSNRSKHTNLQIEPESDSGPVSGNITNKIVRQTGIDDETKPLVNCADCGIGFMLSSWSGYDRVVNLKRRSSICTVCTICQTVFRKNAELLRHVTNHPGVLGHMCFVCGICNVDWSSVEGLLKHISQNYHGQCNRKAKMKWLFNSSSNLSSLSQIVLVKKTASTEMLQGSHHLVDGSGILNFRKENSGTEAGDLILESNENDMLSIKPSITLDTSDSSENETLGLNGKRKRDDYMQSDDADDVDATCDATCVNSVSVLHQPLMQLKLKHLNPRRCRPYNKENRLLGNTKLYEKAKQIKTKQTDIKQLREIRRKYYPKQNEKMRNILRKCRYCDEKVPRSALRNHEASHGRFGQLQCDVCSEAFHFEIHLERHKLRVHPSATSIIQCSLCNTIPCSCSLRDSVINITNDAHTAMQQSVESEHLCTICMCQFASATRLAVHAKFCNPDTPRDHVCEKCGRKCRNKWDLAGHMNSHDGLREHKCPMCPKVFSRADSVRQHLLQHTGEKPYECLTCHQRFTSRHTLRTHNRQHTGNRPFACTTCGRQFTQVGNMLRHVQQHTGQRSHVCTVCSKGYSDTQTLKRHMSKHTGVRDFVCVTCAKAFITNAALKVHMRSHSEERMFTCDICAKSFKVMSHMRRHKKNVHKMFG